MTPALAVQPPSSSRDLRELRSELPEDAVAFEQVERDELARRWRLFAPLLLVVVVAGEIAPLLSPEFPPNIPLSVTMFVLVFAVFLIGQFLEGNVLYPKLVGSSIGINPVWFIFSLFAFSSLFGFVGLLLAVPLSAIAAVLMRFAVQKYRQSQLYLGPNSGPDPDVNAAD